MRIRRILLALVGATCAASATKCALVGDFARDDPGFSNGQPQFTGRFLAVSDADMTATAYADGKLEPLDGEQGQDALTLVLNGEPSASVRASNSVISWPQVIDADARAGLAVVVETRGPAGAGVTRYDSVYTDFPAGRGMSVFRVDGAALTLTDTAADVGLNPGSVELARRGSGPLFAIVQTETEGAELVVAPLSPAGEIGPLRTFDLALPFEADDAEKRARTAHISPDGALLAVNVANRRVQFYDISYDADGVPNAVSVRGQPSPNLGSRLAVGKWSPNGRFFAISDTNWGDSTLHMLTQGPGSVTVLAPPAGAQDAPQQVATARVGRSPEGFSFSAAGDRLATINMERTYLPNLPILSAWPGRRRYSVSLLAFDPDSGALSHLDRIFIAGVLPEDVIFDDDDDALVVAVFHRRQGPQRAHGYLDYFTITGDRLVSQGVDQPVRRGAHDLVSLR